MTTPAAKARHPTNAGTAVCIKNPFPVEQDMKASGREQYRNN